MDVQCISGWKKARVRQAPIPTLAAYDDWLVQRHRREASCRIDGTKLRRAVIMRRQGETWRAVAEALGCTVTAIRAWVAILPLELQP